VAQLVGGLDSAGAEKARELSMCDDVGGRSPTMPRPVSSACSSCSPFIDLTGNLRSPTTVQTCTFIAINRPIPQGLTALQVTFNPSAELQCQVRFREVRSAQDILVRPDR